MTAAKIWNVRVSRFPFGIGDTVGTVTGVNRQDAQRKAEDLYGRDVVVELVHAGLNSPERNRVRRGHENGAPARLGRAPYDEPEPRRPMTENEGRMAQALAVGQFRLGSDKALIRMLHARSLGADRSITTMESRLLRAAVLRFRSELPATIVEMAERAA